MDLSVAHMQAASGGAASVVANGRNDIDIRLNESMIAG